MGHLVVVSLRCIFFCSRSLSLDPWPSQCWRLKFSRGSPAAPPPCLAGFADGPGQILEVSLMQWMMEKEGSLEQWQRRGRPGWSWLWQPGGGQHVADSSLPAHGGVAGGEVERKAGR